MISEGLVTSLNAIREVSVSGSSIYHQYVPVIDENTNIATLAEPVLKYPAVANDFMNMLVNKLVFTQFTTKLYNNPLRILEGERMPLGYFGEELYTNPAKGRKYNVNDFAGLLQKYAADTKVQYLTLNSDLQYPVNVTRHDLKKAFTSWADLDRFIDQLSNSLYNGAFIKDYRMTKNLVSSAYSYGGVRVQTVSAISSEATAKAFVKVVRNAFLGFQVPSTSYNAWAQSGGYGDPITTWTAPEDIVILVRSDIRAKLDVLVESMAYNIDKSTLLGNIITIDNFDAYDDDGTKIFDGSAILGGIFDKSWFRIKRQDMFMDSFYNPNNRTVQYYLNNIKMYGISSFANHMVIALESPTVAPTEIDTDVTSVEVTVGSTAEVKFTTVPFSANTTITYSDGTTTKTITLSTILPGTLE
mgnify:CR=1 FL=1